MAPIHIPRVLASIARGLRKRKPATSVGLGPANPHHYEARVGLFDVDYLGHMNNAAFLAHAEYARWELTAENSLLQTMYDNDTHFMLAGAAVRYRREMKPLFRKFVVNSYLGGLDDKYLWIYQTFRYPLEGNNRIRAQVLVQGVAVQDRKVIDPRHFLKDHGYDSDIVNSLCRPSMGENAKSIDEMMSAFEGLDSKFRDSAAHDDSTNAK